MDEEQAIPNENTLAIQLKETRLVDKYISVMKSVNSHVTDKESLFEFFRSSDINADQYRNQFGEALLADIQKDFKFSQGMAQTLEFLKRHPGALSPDALHYIQNRSPYRRRS